MNFFDKLLRRGKGMGKREFSQCGGSERSECWNRWGPKYFATQNIGGGAMLEFLAGKKLPGIVALNHD